MLQHMIFIERLQWSSLFQLIPHLFSPVRVRYFERTPSGRVLSSLLKWRGLIDIKELDYSFSEVRDSDGSHPMARIEGEDLLTLCREVQEDVFAKHPAILCLQKRFDRGRLLLFLEKCLWEEMPPVLFKIHIVAWFYRKEGGDGNPPIYFMLRRPFAHWLQSQAKEIGVSIQWYGLGWKIQIPFRKILRKLGTFHRRIPTRAMGILRNFFRENKNKSGAKQTKVIPQRVAVPYCGKGLGFDLSRNTDLFWVPFTHLPSDHLLVYFHYPVCPLDEEKFEVLKKQSIQAVATRALARTSSRVPLWWKELSAKKLLRGIGGASQWVFSLFMARYPFSKMDRWVFKKMLNFVFHYTFWRTFLRHYNVKVFVNYIDWTAERVAIDQAVADLEGISVSYQRSEEAFASTFRTSCVDVHFAFSHSMAATERQSRSQIRHFVGIGYPHDHAFSRVKLRAQQHRNQLMKEGAEFILCFFDGSSVDDKRVFCSHEYRAVDYQFLLEKLLNDPQLGLIIKPKKSADLRHRLRGTLSLLEQALKTKRCLLFETGSRVSTEILPCEASMAADVAIAILWGATPGIESALAGTPTLFMDRENVKHHPLYQFREGNIVFQNWESLWEHLICHRNGGKKASLFGSGACLGEYDSFRDGKAAERMGDYIHSLTKGLSMGLSREQVMNFANENYVKRWGRDKEVCLI